MSTSEENLYILARKKGLPREQLENFINGGYIPYPWALDFHKAAREADAEGGPTELLAGGARGPGKTFAVFNQAALDDCQRFPGLKVLFLRQLGKMASESIDDLRQKVLVKNGVPHDFNGQKGIIRFPHNGSRIVIGNFKDERDIDKYLGLEYHIIIVEEATQLTKERIQALRDSNRASDGFRPRFYLTTNPGGKGHGYIKSTFVDPHRRGKETWTRFFPATIDDNPLIDKNYKNNLEKNTGWRLRAYRYGDWDIAAGLYFTNFRSDIHVVADVPRPVTWDWWAGIDYGFHHPTAFVLGCQDGDGNIYVVDEHVGRKQLPAWHVDKIAKMLDKWGVGDLLPATDSPYMRVANHRLKSVAGGADFFAQRGARDDAKTTADQYADLGLTIKVANMDRKQGASEILTRFGEANEDGAEVVPPRLFISERCRHLIDGIMAMQHDPDDPEDILKVDADDEGEGGDDVIDSFRYFTMERVAKPLPKQSLRYAKSNMPHLPQFPYPFT